MIKSVGQIKILNGTKVRAMIKSNIVVIVSVIAAFLTSLIITPDNEYWSYFDFRTLTTLFCMLAIVCAFKNIHFFQISAYKIVAYFKTTRTAILALVYITFIGSMIIANDMALLTFLPLGYYVLNSTNQKKHMAFTFIMQNIAANLGDMHMPFGNPQSLYLYSFFVFAGNVSRIQVLSNFFENIMGKSTLLTGVVACQFISNVPSAILLSRFTENYRELLVALNIG